MSACPARRAVSSSRCINTHRRLTGEWSPNIAAGPIQTRRRDDGVNPGPSVAVGPDGGGQRVLRVHHVVGDFDVRTGEATPHPEQVRAGQMLRQPHPATGHSGLPEGKEGPGSVVRQPAVDGHPDRGAADDHPRRLNASLGSTSRRTRAKGGTSAGCLASR
jgi:hypothetical protein